MAIAIIVILMALLPASLSCSNSEAEALRIAKDWTSDADNMAWIKTDIAILVVDNVPDVDGLFFVAIHDQIQDAIWWKYSVTKIPTNYYRVIATATATLSLSMLEPPFERDYKISVDYGLIVTTSTEEVASDIVAGSFDFSKLD
ncbi:hypothetical protein ACFLVP_02730 [Chloroflexota bacterium]